jgi:EmrB/QacA subfamily drug resistance transporter
MAGDLDGASQRWFTRGHPGTVLLLACTAWFMVILDVSIVNVALPSIRHALRFSQENLQWVVNAYTLTFAGLLLLGGRAGDLLGRRRMFLVGVALFTLASVVGGTAQSQGVLVAARGLQGIGGAVIAPTTLSIISTTFAEGTARNRALGIWGMIGAAGGSAGALLGGLLTQGLSWRWILFVNIPIGIVTLLVSARLVPESHAPSRGQRHFDLAGAFTVTAGLIAIVFAIVRTDVNGWGSAQTLGVLAAGVLLLGAFVLIEARVSARPLVPLRIFRSRMLTGANATILWFSAAMFPMWFLLTLYLQEVLGYDPIEAGLSFLPLTLGIMAGSALASRLVSRVGSRPLVVLGTSLMCVGMLLYARMPADGTFLGDVLPASIPMALGMALAFVPCTIAAVSGVAPSEAGLASGLLNTARQVGGSLGLAILATVATSRTNGLLRAHDGLASALTAGYQRAFLLGAAFSLVAAVTALVLLRPPRGRAAQAAGGDAATTGAEIAEVAA